MQRYIVRAINPSDMSVVLINQNGGRSANRSNALVFTSLKAAIHTRDIARKENKSAWIAFV
jgi:hypothetical protein